ncbi:bifunctional 4-hydroxy-2-oxoglutarate aldolase/2-dehydro-3-deoxy-phosphogluconate aldolase [Sediminibacillus halophilus]|uniref:2-dehydro-3-deoxyphosphogluconate aldolase / (4S)-4-hydroxy-2-oxoglutarate aldolase n=1 Tax=Sediminibacillus halophilus TaxID=482461 RepID=A0A1G9RKF3_9BACI|nr:bifunctional 4-hydroxy-2-oxoglutarate aldolase/2-dehydro-3-deoxy-phosphogluconate aldolase [Sediminibacillus halophilus]SDM23703.1 2-dehydro-3-deoxyphosphogluconate aldolase / (4S)-4-hydroxy-2-oxoglutarate aldolase [Sediminibacillus halophilus]
MRNALDMVKQEKIVSIIRLDQADQVEEVARSLYSGGINIIEVTMNTPGALEAIRTINQMPEAILAGAGTVLDAAAANAAIRAGAQFLLAPTLNTETIKMGNRYGVPVIPGVMTPTEALTAHEAGARMVKVFPVRSLGPAFAKDMKGPLPQTELMAVGGVSAENAGEFFQAGWDAVGIGGSLVNSQLVREKRYDEIETAAKKLVEARDKAFQSSK